MAFVNLSIPDYDVLRLGSVQCYPVDKEAAEMPLGFG